MLNYPKAFSFHPASAYPSLNSYHLPVPARHPDYTLSLPIYPEMTAKQVQQVAGEICEFFR